MEGLDKAKYEADLTEAGNDEAKRKIIQVRYSKFLYLLDLSTP
jgi:hypothetical protein